MKSLGPDNITPRVLFEARVQLALPLSVLFKKSLLEGKVPSDWKSANITPIFKKGDKKIASNYRPVSLTSVICKIMEKTVREAILRHMKHHHILSNKQYGFLPGRSTLLQLLTTLEKWIQDLDHGKQVDVIYTDFRKAFDKVSHGRLLMVLERYGIREELHSWLRDFLTGRKQRVTVGGEVSDWTGVKSGVPQGSVLGPTLFVAYINSLPDVVSNSEIYLYADDMKIFHSISKPQDSRDLQRDLDNVVSWYDRFLLELHPEKCKSMTLCSGRQTPEDRSYHIKEHQLDISQAEKGVGVIMDTKLSFENHVHEKIGKANRILGVVRRSFLYLDDQTFLYLYKALIRPHLEYCNQVWSPHLRKHINSLESRTSSEAQQECYHR